MNVNDRSSAAVGPSRVRLQLERVLGSEPFARCARMRRFLTFVVEETLSGRSEQLGEYGIGLAVFDRDPDFQPQLDPIVRNDARRLRQKLLEYYRQAEPQEVIIEIPKGGYVPVFARAARVHTPTGDSRPRLAVMPFEVHSDGPELTMLATTLGLSMTASLTEMEGFGVVAHGAVRDRSELRESGAALRLTHAIHGVLLNSGDLCRAMVSLIQVSDATQLWAGEYEVDLTDALSTQYGIVAATLREVMTRLTSLGSSCRLTLVA